MWGVWQVQGGHGEREISKGADDVRTSLLCHTHFVQGSATSRPPSQLSAVRSRCFGFFCSPVYR